METREQNLNYATSVITNLAPAREIENEEKILYKTIKRTIDIIGAIIGCILLIPLTVVVYIANLITKGDNGPIFYIQKRIGQDGKMFRIYKYRTMVVGADKKLKKYLKENPEAAKEYKKYKKLKEDPRITKIGKILRKTSLDEFPQFINVLKGEMSIVGPRPYLFKEKKDMGEYYKKIIKCKPGLTGIWQVSRRSDVTFQKRLNMDIEYLNTRCTKLDIKLILKTFTKIFKKEGAI